MSYNQIHSEPFGFLNTTWEIGFCRNKVELLQK